VRQLIEHQVFSSVRDNLQDSSRELSTAKGTVLLLSNPSLNGALSLAPIEASLIDEEIPYRRRFSRTGPSLHISITIIDDPSIERLPEPSSPGIILAPVTVEGLRGRLGDSRKGTLSTVAQAHVIAQCISPSSPRLRRMRPWVLSGNWIGGALDTTYDPVYSALRDFLSNEGSIRVVPVTEVPSPEDENYEWLEPGAIANISNEWESLDLEKRAESMDSLAEPAILRNVPSTARLEELLWHCILAPEWKSDLASQITRASNYWDRKTSKDASSELVDSLISKGTL
tara:strand:- start:205 stop:1059 length:855 start_codon:yes stop_codon:yes gene_type:complete